MHHLLVAYRTYDGHTAKIVDRIAQTHRAAGCQVDVCDLAQPVSRRPLDQYAGVIVGGPLHGGRHPPQLAKFVSTHLTKLNEKPSAFFSVSLSAAGTEEQRNDAWQCVRRFLDETDWQPTQTTIFAGALLYREYGFFKRWLMKMIVKRAGGDSDTSKNHEYTDWLEVEQFAREFVGRLTKTGSETTIRG